MGLSLRNRASRCGFDGCRGPGFGELPRWPRPLQHVRIANHCRHFSHLARNPGGFRILNAENQRSSLAGRALPPTVCIDAGIRNVGNRKAVDDVLGSIVQGVQRDIVKKPVGRENEMTTFEQVAQRSENFLIELLQAAVRSLPELDFHLVGVRGSEAEFRWLKLQHPHKISDSLHRGQGNNFDGSPGKNGGQNLFACLKIPAFPLLLATGRLHGRAPAPTASRHDRWKPLPDGTAPAQCGCNTSSTRRAIGQSAARTVCPRQRARAEVELARKWRRAGYAILPAPCSREPLRRVVLSSRAEDRGSPDARRMILTGENLVGPGEQRHCQICQRAGCFIIHAELLEAISSLPGHFGILRQVQLNVNLRQIPVVESGVIDVAILGAGLASGAGSRDRRCYSPPETSVAAFSAAQKIASLLINIKGALELVKADEANSHVMQRDPDALHVPMLEKLRVNPFVGSERVSQPFQPVIDIGDVDVETRESQSVV